MKEVLATAPYVPPNIYQPPDWSSVIRGIVNLALAGGLLVAAYFMLRGFHGETFYPAIPLQKPLVAALMLGMAGALIADVFYANEHYSRRWGARFALVGLAIVALLYQPYFTIHGWVVWTLFVAILVFMHHACGRFALGWFWDEYGELQKVEHVANGQALYRASTWQKRVSDEKTCADERREKLLIFGLPAAILAAITLTAWQDHTWWLAGLAGLFAIPFAIQAAVPAFLTLLVFLCYPDVPGARVLDPEPIRPGLRDVMAQDVYSHPKIADEADLESLFNPKQ